jgi:hypothetical protein
MTNLSRLTVVPVREVWAHEAHHFTRWMLENAEVLGDALGLELELHEAEHKVGGFSLDLIGQDLTTGDVVIVENQLESTDHGHLGQLMTYAGGTNPSIVVWCAPSFRDEHRAALDWLNEHTGEDTRFFGVEVSAVRIDDSRPAPLFRMVAQPNDWTKQVHTEKAVSLSGKSVAYREFWVELLSRIRENHPDWAHGWTGSSQSWITLPYGRSTAWYGLVFTRVGPRVELYFGASQQEINTAEFNLVLDHRDLLNARFGPGLVYDELPGKKAWRIHIDRPEGGDVLNEADRETYLTWFIDVMERFRPATQQVRSLIDAAR